MTSKWWRRCGFEVLSELVSGSFRQLGTSHSLESGRDSKNLDLIFKFLESELFETLIVDHIITKINY